jgi:hypothetical protein
MVRTSNSIQNPRILPVPVSGLKKPAPEAPRSHNPALTAIHWQSPGPLQSELLTQLLLDLRL